VNNLVIANRHDGLSLADAFTVHPVANERIIPDEMGLQHVHAHQKLIAGVALNRQSENGVHLTGLQKDILADPPAPDFMACFAGTRFPAEEAVKIVSDIGWKRPGFRITRQA